MRFVYLAVHCSISLVTLCGSFIFISSARVSLPTCLLFSKSVVLCPVFEGNLAIILLLTCHSCTHIRILFCIAVVSVSLFVSIHIPSS